jgi:hypothetical protein
MRRFEILRLGLQRRVDLFSSKCLANIGVGRVLAAKALGALWALRDRADCTNNLRAACGATLGGQASHSRRLP